MHVPLEGGSSEGAPVAGGVAARVGATMVGAAIAGAANVGAAELVPAVVGTMSSLVALDPVRGAVATPDVDGARAIAPVVAVVRGAGACATQISV